MAQIGFEYLRLRHPRVGADRRQVAPEQLLPEMAE